jgi:hypothetical protein
MTSTYDRRGGTPAWQRIAFVVLLGYLITMMMLLGGLLLETFMIYPNIFTDAPARFGISLQFMSVTGPAQYFRPFGMATVAFGVLGVVAAWQWRTARWWAVGSAAAIALEGIISRLYFWPLNTTLFVEGASVHPAEVLRQSAADFQTWHWSRVALNAASAACILIAFLRFHRGIVRTQQGGRVAGSAAAADRLG